jgi:hypothetical protein
VAACGKPAAGCAVQELLGLKATSDADEGLRQSGLPASDSDCWPSAVAGDRCFCTHVLWKLESDELLARESNSYPGRETGKTEKLRL